MTLVDFRSIPANIAAARALQASDTWKTIRQVLEAEHPARRALAIDARPEVRAAWQSSTEGYERALNVLEALVEPHRERKQLKSTYQPPKE